MGMKRKVLTIFTLVFLLLVSVASFAGGTKENVKSTSKEPVKVTFFHYFRVHLQEV